MKIGKIPSITTRDFFVINIWETFYNTFNPKGTSSGKTCIQNY